jgi:hypothetical protein
MCSTRFGSAQQALSGMERNRKVLLGSAGVAWNGSDMYGRALQAMSGLDRIRPARSGTAWLGMAGIV